MPLFIRSEEKTCNPYKNTGKKLPAVLWENLTQDKSTWRWGLSASEISPTLVGISNQGGLGFNMYVRFERTWNIEIEIFGKNQTNHKPTV